MLGGQSGGWRCSGGSASIFGPLDFCVYFSAVDGAKLGFEVFVIKDACKAIDLEGSLASSLDEMNSKGVSIITSSALLS